MAKEVLIYVTRFCPWCRLTKEFLKKNNIKYKEIDVEEDEDALREMVKKSKQYGVPVIDIDRSIVVGFDEVKLKKLLNIK